MKKFLVILLVLTFGIGLGYTWDLGEDNLDNAEYLLGAEKNDEHYNLKWYEWEPPEVEVEIDEIVDELMDEIDWEDLKGERGDTGETGESIPGESIQGTQGIQGIPGRNFHNETELVIHTQLNLYNSYKPKFLLLRKFGVFCEYDARHGNWTQFGISIEVGK